MPEIAHSFTFLSNMTWATMTKNPEKWKSLPMLTHLRNTVFHHRVNFTNFTFYMIFHNLNFLLPRAVWGEKGEQEVRERFSRHLNRLTMLLLSCGKLTFGSCSIITSGAGGIFVGSVPFTTAIASPFGIWNDACAIGSSLVSTLELISLSLQQLSYDSRYDWSDSIHGSLYVKVFVSTWYAIR